MEMIQLVDVFETRFKAAGVDNPRRVTEELLAHIFQCNPPEIYTHAANAVMSASSRYELIERIEPLAARIENGEPLQYVVGNVDFWGLFIKCDPRALIPRPETELLVEEVLSSNIWIRDDDDAPTLVDVGTGTGCIALTLSQQRPDLQVKAVDISNDALTLAQENAKLNGLEGRINWIKNDLLEGFPRACCDVVVANLPYIATDDWAVLSSSVKDHEPRNALDSGPSGMELIQLLAKQAREVLVSEGKLYLEFGYDQGKAVTQCLEKFGYIDIQIKHDLSGHDRIAIASSP